MKRIIVGILVLMIAAMSAAAWAAKDAGSEGVPGHGGPEKGLVRMLEDLNLTPEQKKQVAAILVENREQARTMRQSMKQAHEAMRKVMDTTPGDEAAVRKAAQAMGRIGEDMAVRLGSVKARIDAVLTPEQKEQAARKREELTQRFKNRGDRGQKSLDEWIAKYQ
uniref:Periplasmic heavy metal sensor n=1 Tax=Fundidesulfovibrio putealis TaxID=270496 RepID=A0A7C4AGH8_9BACT